MQRLPTKLALVGALAALACRTGAPTPTAPTTPGIDPALVDPAVKPCDDFYAYACGNWLKAAVIPPDKARWDRSFREIEERNLARLRAIAEDDAAGRLDAADRYPDKVGAYYAACMDEATIAQRGLPDLKAEWARIDGVTDVAGLAREVAGLHARGVFPLFVVGSTPDRKDVNQVIGLIAQGGLSLPDRDYYLKDDARTVQIQKSFREHVAKMLRLAGMEAGRASADADHVVALERSMAQAQRPRVEMRDPYATYNRVDLAGLEQAAPRFPWKAYLAQLGHPDLTAFTTTTPAYLTRIDELLQKTPAATWRAYLRWRVLSAMARARAVPAPLVDEDFAFESANFTGAKEPEARWKHCVRETDGALGEALGQAFTRRWFGGDAKEKTRELVTNVEGAMGRDLDGLAWMDAATREHARAKLARVLNKVGYPDQWRNYDALQVDRGSFLRSLLAAQRFEVNRQLDKIGKPLDRSEWRMTPATVNAYYSPPLNEMVFPAGILQAPFYTQGAPDAVNYGAIGMVVGHELTHGFDDQGRKFDAAGNLADWWTPAVSEEFDRRAACVVRQYDGYVAVDDVKLNGRLTLGENLADLGGLKLAHAAYRATRAGRPPEPPVAGFTADQAFFVAYAQAWCTAIRPENARLRAQTDPHSPARWRVDGPLSNLLEFRRAFACPDGSPMARSGDQRCEVW